MKVVLEGGRLTAKALRGHGAGAAWRGRRSVTPEVVLPASLRAAEPVKRGMAFLEKVVGGTGAWPGRRYGNLQLAGPSVEEQPPFIAGLGVLALKDVPGTNDLIACTRRSEGLTTAAFIKALVRWCLPQG